MDKPKLTIDFDGWMIGAELSHAVEKAVLDCMAAFVSDFLTAEDTCAWLQTDGVLIDNPTIAFGRDAGTSVTIPWGWPLIVSERMGALDPLFRLIREQWDLCDVSAEDRAKLRAILD